MKRYPYRSDGEASEVEADSLAQAFEIAKQEAGVTRATLADGAWLWVEDPDTGERMSIGEIP